VNIRINGTETAVPDGQTLSDYLAAGKFDLAAVVVELNETLIARDQWTTLSLAEGDRLEVVSFVGGG